MNYKYTTALLLGVLVGMSCKEAIDTATISTAYAIPSETTTTTTDALTFAAAPCDQWEAREVEIGNPLQPGWEPFGYTFCTSGYACMAVRRCVD